VKTNTYISRILWYQGIGFLIIILFTWFFEIFDFPFGLKAIETPFNWREGIVENLAVMAVAISVMFLTRRMLSRLYYLEGFLRVCAWCKKLENNNEWIPIEDFFKEKFQTESTHGICPECLKKAQGKIKPPTSADEKP